MIGVPRWIFWVVTILVAGSVAMRNGAGSFDGVAFVGVVAGLFILARLYRAVWTPPTAEEINRSLVRDTVNRWDEPASSTGMVRESLGHWIAHDFVTGEEGPATLERVGDELRARGDRIAQRFSVRRATVWRGPEGDLVIQVPPAAEGSLGQHYWCEPGAGQDVAALVARLVEAGAAKGPPPPRAGHGA